MLSIAMGYSYLLLFCTGLSLQRAIQSEPRYALAHFNKANLYFYNSRWEDAIQAYSTVMLSIPLDLL